MCVQASSGAAELAAAQARAAAQLQALESQLVSKDSALEATEVRLAALDAELKGANSKVRPHGHTSRLTGLFLACSCLFNLRNLPVCLGLAYLKPKECLRPYAAQTLLTGSSWTDTGSAGCGSKADCGQQAATAAADCDE